MQLLPHQIAYEFRAQSFLRQLRPYGTSFNYNAICSNNCTITNFYTWYNLLRYFHPRIISDNLLPLITLNNWRLRLGRFSPPPNVINKHVYYSCHSAAIHNKTHAVAIWHKNQLITNKVKGTQDISLEVAASSGVVVVGALRAGL